MPIFSFNEPFLNCRKLKSHVTIVLLLVFLVGMPLGLVAQDDKSSIPLEKFYVDRKKNMRSLFKNFRFGASTGYGNTYFSHTLSGFDIYQVAGKAPEIFATGSGPATRYTNWVTSAGKDVTASDPAAYTISSGSSKLGFKGNAMNIPLKLTLHYEYKRYRIGGGYAWELMSIGMMHPISHPDKISSFAPGPGTGLMKKYFGSIGASFARIDNYLFIGDVNIGGFKPGSNFNSGQIKTGIYFNLGVTAERELSEYLRVYARPSFDFKSYDLSVPGGGAIHHNINAFYINIGFTYTIPELPRCFKNDCSVQINHAHGNKEYRSRVHPIFKKQNPGYGENNQLIKYKGKNKRKLNPY